MTNASAMQTSKLKTRVLVNLYFYKHVEQRQWMIFINANYIWKIIHEFDSFFQSFKAPALIPTSPQVQKLVACNHKIGTEFPR